MFMDQNLASVGGYAQTLQLIQVKQQLTLQRDSLTDGLRLQGKLYLEYSYNKDKVY